MNALRPALRQATLIRRSPKLQNDLSCRWYTLAHPKLKSSTHKLPVMPTIISGTPSVRCWPKWSGNSERLFTTNSSRSSSVTKSGTLSPTSVDGHDLVGEKSLCKDADYVPALIAFGSNLGDRFSYIEAALKLMPSRGIVPLKVSSLYETKAMYYEDQGAFLNGVCLVKTRLQPLRLLDALQAIETELGRVRTIDKGPRTLDLDIILYGSELVETERLRVPHIGVLERDFVLRPMAE